ncbi:MAG: SAM-dependent methyltransferase [Rhodospirillaceae bacterium]|nr:SAM-dependent methyltransferase [Rhodospirillaceae bacterium]|tara:strand:+ start:19202 stop:20008 length:807 start_codon:yes stop_codon:yes gene_type:complete
MNEHHDINKRWWNEVTPVHTTSEFYDVDGFIKGRNTLGSVERDAVGPVDDKKFLHMQCHFGMDTLSWARLGATVTGVDFSSEAVAKARELAEATGLDDRARFVESDITAVGKLDDAPYDVIFTSFGTIVWLKSLEGWAETIASNLAGDGFFYFLDSHPTAMLFDEESAEPKIIYDYFHSDDPNFEEAGSADYADWEYRIQSEARSFNWGLADIFAALESKGLTICEVREYPFGAWRHFPDMTKADDGYWYRDTNEKALPLLLGFKATW